MGRTVLVPLVVAFVSSAAARAAPYEFDLLAETPRPTAESVGVYRLPALNDGGAVTFSQPRAGSGNTRDRVIYTGTPGNLRAVDTPGLQVLGGVSINNHGRIGFVGNDAIPPAFGVNSLYAVDPGRPVIPITHGEYGRFDYNGFGYVETAISDSGAVMSVTDGPMNVASSVIIGDGSAPAREVFRTVDQYPGQSRYITKLIYPRMSSAGDWAAWEDAGSGLPYTAIHTNYGSIYVAPTVFPIGQQSPRIISGDIAANGVLVFQQKLQDQPAALFTSRAGGPAAPVPGSEGLGEGHVAVNDAGDIALLNGTEEDKGTRLVLLRGGVPETVLSAGDPLLGSTVSTIGFDPKGFNNADQFALLVALADGRDVYVLASPVPEPGAAAVLLALAGAPLVRRGSRRRLSAYAATPVSGAA